MWGRAKTAILVISALVLAAHGEASGLEDLVGLSCRCHRESTRISQTPSIYAFVTQHRFEKPLYSDWERCKEHQTGKQPTGMLH